MQEFQEESELEQELKTMSIKEYDRKKRECLGLIELEPNSEIVIGSSYRFISFIIALYQYIIITLYNGYIIARSTLVLLWLISKRLEKIYCIMT